MDETQRLRAVWETWARRDPLFAILSDPHKQGSRWDINEFMEHTPELDAALALAAEHRLLRGRRLALDFGCGVGRITQALTAHFDRVVGLDISEAMIDQAVALNRVGDRCRYVCGNLNAFPENTFDFVFSVYVIQHIPHALQGETLRELVRVVKPNGVIACQIPQPQPGLQGLRRRLAPRLLKALKFKLRYGNDAPLIEMNPLPEPEVKRLIEPAQLVAHEGEWFFISPDPHRAQAAA
jgi:SAM-dependent methyltransferase